MEGCSPASVWRNNSILGVHHPAGAAPAGSRGPLCSLSSGVGLSGLLGRSVPKKGPYLAWGQVPLGVLL